MLQLPAIRQRSAKMCASFLLAGRVARFFHRHIRAAYMLKSKGAWQTAK
jgi:hypothetical protein